MIQQMLFTSRQSLTSPFALVVFAPLTGEIPLNVTLTSPETVNLIYTLDGTAPTLSNGVQVPSPVTLSLLVPCTVRAVATDGVLISAESQHTYSFTGRQGDPRSVGGLISWYRSDSVEVTAGLVSTWFDQSGNNFHATPHNDPFPAGGVGPTLVNSVLNGWPALRFDGLHSFLETAYQNYGQPNTWFVVAKQTSKATLGYFLSGFGDANMIIGCDTNGHYFIGANYAGPGTSTFLVTDTSVDRSGVFHLYESLWDGAATKGWVDGVQVFTATSPDSSAQIIIGRRPQSEDYLTGDIAEVIRFGYGGSPTAADMKWLESYLSNRYMLPNRVPFYPGPQNVAGLFFWLKADSIAQSDGTEVTTWSDSSGNGHTFPKGTTPGPTFKTNIVNGSPVVRFNGSQNFHSVEWATLGIAQPFTIIVAAKVTANGYLWYNPPYPRCEVQVTTTTLSIVTDPGTTLRDNINHQGAWHVFVTEFNHTSSRGFVDGVQTMVGDAGDGSFSQPYVGYAMTGDISEVAVYRRILTTAERNEIESYMKVKYGIP